MIEWARIAHVFRVERLNRDVMLHRQVLEPSIQDFLSGESETAGRPDIILYTDSLH